MKYVKVINFFQQVYFAFYFGITYQACEDRTFEKLECDLADG